MGTRDPRISVYIEQSAAFAQPVLRHLRAVVHASCPDVVETMKWNSPSFEYKGMLCGMAAFKQHCVFGFWKHELVLEGLDEKARTAMGSFGRLKTIADLPSKAALARYIKKAVALNDAGVKNVRKKTRPTAPVRMHPALALALEKNRKAKATFQAFPPSHKRDYIEWIAEAKAEATRDRRLAQAIEWMVEGKPRNWKYMKC